MRSPKETLERNLKRARGKLTSHSTLTQGRQYAIAVEGTVITFECKRAGHTYKVDMASKRKKVVQRLGEAATRFHASWWSKEKGGCIGECPKCAKAEKVAATPPLPQK